MPLDQLCGRHCPPFQEEEHDSGVETRGESETRFS